MNVNFLTMIKSIMFLLTLFDPIANNIKLPRIDIKVLAYEFFKEVIKVYIPFSLRL